MMSPTLQGAALHQHGADRTAAALQLGFDDDAFGRAVGIGLELEQLGLQMNGFQQLVDAGLLERRHLDLERLARHALHDDFVLQQVGAHALGIGVGLVDLVDGHDHLHAGGLGVVDGLHRLRHHAVVGSHHQHHEVGDLGAAGAHGGERLVAGRIDERDLLAVGRHHLIGADMLRDASGLAGHHVGLANGIEQRGLAVVDVAHDGDDRRPRLLVLVDIGGSGEAFLDVGLRHALGRVAELAHDQLGRVGVDHVVDLVHRALVHQEPDDVDGALGHAVGEFLDGDDLRNDDFAHDLVARLLNAGLLELLALTLAAQRCQRALALRLVEGVVDRELAALAAFLAHPGRALGDFGALLLAAAVVVGVCGLDVELALADGFGAAQLGLRLVRRRQQRRPDLRRAAAWRRRVPERLGRTLRPAASLRRLHNRRLGLLGFFLGTLGFQQRGFPRLGLGAFLGDLQGAATRIHLVGGQAAGMRQGRVALGLRVAAVDSSPSPEPEIVRFFFFSTTTDFDRPWLKL